MFYDTTGASIVATLPQVRRHSLERLRLSRDGCTCRRAQFATGHGRRAATHDLPVSVRNGHSRWPVWPCFFTSVNGRVSLRAAPYSSARKEILVKGSLSWFQKKSTVRFVSLLSIRDGKELSLARVKHVNLFALIRKRSTKP